MKFQTVELGCGPCGHQYERTVLAAKAGGQPALGALQCPRCRARYQQTVRTWTQPFEHDPVAKRYKETLAMMDPQPKPVKPEWMLKREAQHREEEERKREKREAAEKDPDNPATKYLRTKYGRQ